MIRRVVAVAALAALALASAAGAQALLAPPAAMTEDGPGVTVELTQYSPAVLEAGGQLTVTANVSNSAALAAIGLEVTLAVTQGPLRSSAALERFLDDPTSAGTQVAATKPVNSSTIIMNGAPNVLPPGGSVPIQLTGTPSTLGMPPDTAGVYGVLVSVSDSSGTLATRTAAITWHDAEITPLRMSFIASASGSPERAAQVISAASVPGAAIIIDPVTISDSSQATALVSGREVFGTLSGDPDFTSLAHGDDLTLLDFAARDARENSQPALQNLPLLATIPAVDAPTIELAESKGAVAGLLDVAGGATRLGSGPVVDVAAGTITLPVLVPNARLSKVLADYRPGMPDAAARVVAEAALVAEAGDGITPVVVAPGAAWELTGPGVSQPLAELLGAPWVIPVSAQSVISGTARGSADAPTIAGTADDLGADLIKALSRQFDDLSQLSLTAEDPASIYVPGGRTLLEPLAVGLRTNPDARTTTYQAARDDVAATLAGLHVAAGSDVNLIAASGNVPITLRNDLPVDATVTVVMRSASPNLVVQDTPVVTIPAGGDVTALVAVTGVKSANVSATVALENSEGDVVAAPQVIHVRVRADWGNAVTAVFSVGLALLLIAGIIRTIRRGRRSSRMAPMSPPEAAEAAETVDPAESTRKQDGAKDG